MIKVFMLTYCSYDGDVCVPCIDFGNGVYAHEPICDTYASVHDLLIDYPGDIRAVGALALDPEAA